MSFGGRACRQFGPSLDLLADQVKGCLHRLAREHVEHCGRPGRVWTIVECQADAVGMGESKRKSECCRDCGHHRRRRRRNPCAYGRRGD